MWLFPTTRRNCCFPWHDNGDPPGWIRAKILTTVQVFTSVYTFLCTDQRATTCIGEACDFPPDTSLSRLSVVWWWAMNNWEIDVGSFYFPCMMKRNIDFNIQVVIFLICITHANHYEHYVRKYRYISIINFSSFLKVSM